MSLNNPIKKLLVTGGAGFMGSAFVRYVCNVSPHTEILILDALTYAGDLSRLDECLSDNVRFYEGDICDRDLLDEYVSHVDAVVHFAAETDNDRSIVDAAPFVKSNVEGTLCVSNACVTHNVRLHHVSTDEVFGDLPFGSSSRFTEASPYNPSSPYAATKAASDMIVRSYIRTHGLQATISNSCNNYGPYQHKDRFIPKTIDLVSRGERPKVYGTGQNIREWIHVNDHSAAVWEILNHGKLGESYLIGSGVEKSNLEVVGTILEAFDRDPHDYELVDDRAGHDRRYALDHTKLTTELEWMPEYLDFEATIAQLASCARSNI